MYAYQLDFFKPAPTEHEMLLAEVERLRESNNRVRKSQFAKLGEMMKMYIELKSDLDLLKMHICKNKIC